MDSQLITIGKATHARHNAEHVVVGRIHTHRGAGRRANRVVGDRDEERRVVNA